LFTFYPKCWLVSTKDLPVCCNARIPKSGREQTAQESRRSSLWLQLSDTKQKALSMDPVDQGLVVAGSEILAHPSANANHTFLISDFLDEFSSSICSVQRIFLIFAQPMFILAWSQIACVGSYWRGSRCEPGCLCSGSALARDDLGGAGTRAWLARSNNMEKSPAARMSRRIERAKAG